ncbi:predicted protein [Streptomyces albidoflavus]|nr:predicted protein [Streptomyces albidoflavus]
MKSASRKAVRRRGARSERSVRGRLGVLTRPLWGLGGVGDGKGLEGRAPVRRGRGRAVDRAAPCGVRTGPDTPS